MDAIKFLWPEPHGNYTGYVEPDRPGQDHDEYNDESFPVVSLKAYSAAAADFLLRQRLQGTVEIDSAALADGRIEPIPGIFKHT